MFGMKKETLKVSFLYAFSLEVHSRYSWPSSSSR